MTISKPVNDRKTLIARGIVAMLILSTLVQILSHSLTDNPDDFGEPMEPDEQTQSMYVQTYDVGNQNRGGYHLVSEEWWEPPRPIEVTNLDWDGDGTTNSLDSHPLDPAIPFAYATTCFVPMANCTSDSQGFIADKSPTWESPEALYAEDLALGDIDGDGDLDLVIGYMSSQSIGAKDKVYLNNNGTFSDIAHWSSPLSHTTKSVALGDVDADGDLDLALGTRSYNYIYLNDGSNFSSSYDWRSPSSKITSALKFSDIDNDGYLDLVIGNGDSSYTLANEVFFNNNGVMSSTAGWTSSDSQKTQDIAVADMNGNGYPDLVVANRYSAPQVFYNNASGLSTTADSNWSPSSSNSGSVALGDADGDGDLDIALGQGDVNVYYNSGSEIADSPAWSSEESSGRNNALAWGDIDGDGDYDLVAGHGCCNIPETLEIFVNNDKGLETTASWEPNNYGNTYSVELGDLNGDGRLDLVRANREEPVEMYLNRGGTLDSNPAWESSDELDSTSLAWGDIDGDGDVDLAVANLGDNLQVFLNDAGTISSSADWESSNTMNAYDVKWGDVDGDGDLDLAVGRSGTNEIYFNTGSNLSTTPGWTSSDSKTSYAIEFGDIDDDDDLDLVVGNYNSQNQVFFNSGSSISTSAGWTSSDTQYTRDIALGDVDGDGDLDLAVGGNGGNSAQEKSQIYFGTGSTFSTTAGWTSPTIQKTYSIELADFDGDGNLDLLQGNWLQNDYIFSNSGSGLPTSYTDILGVSERTQGTAVADVDGDGDIDIARAINSAEDELFINDGSGEFHRAWLSKYSEPGWGMAFADVNNDGIMDLGIANYDDWNSPNRIYFGILDSDRDWYSDSDDDLDQDPTQYSDVDGDGHGDTSTGWSPDDCTGYWGDSWRDRIGCPDEDGDGQSNLNDDFWRKDTQWVDTDGDGLGDNWGNNSWDASRSGAWPGQYIANAYLQDPYPLDYDNDGFEDGTLSGAVAPFDNCPFVYGLSTEDVNGCPDSDGDGYSDLSDSHSGDQTQWSDTDNDGYGDNWGDGTWNQSRAGGVGQWVQSASSPDHCPTTWGNSTVDYFGCTDNDGDGYSSLTDVDDNDGKDWNDADNDGFGDNADQCPFSWGNITLPSDKGCPDSDGDGHADRSDDLPYDATQWSDKDDDGYGDNIAGNTPDACQNDRGASTRGVIAGANTTKYGCADSDSDGYANTDDPCPFSYGNSWVDRFACPDSDQDGISDFADPYPNNATSDIEDWDGDGFLDHSDGSNTDDFPTDSTQNTDSDGDGFGDNPNGNSGDQFPDELTQWQDLDGDGYGDNQAPGAFEPDRCPSTSGNSTTDRFGCTDTDGDGFSDSTPGYFAHPQGQADSHPNDASQYRDKDGDGYGDNPSGTFPDSCDNKHGTSTLRILITGTNETWYGCPDADGDSYEDDSDPCKNQFGNSWVDRFACPDSDQDGISDDVDPYPNTATSNTDDWDDDGIININDDFPADNTQNTDTDGDGFGDNATGNYPDAFINEISQWSDVDGDGYGDNKDGVNPDECIYEMGNSTTPVFGCIDTDGDGTADDYDDFPRDPTQQLDSDGDGYGDHGHSNQTDDCPYKIGDSTLGKVGCPDSDGDGWADDDDECPDQYGNSGEPFTGCLDRDGDNVADIVDVFPDDANESADFDGDGIGDISDPFPFDYDNDNVSTELDWDDHDPNEHLDSDGDGTGDNADVWPYDSEIWSDVDGDGFADQYGHPLTDDCPSINGTSTKFMQGCSDMDFDGMPDLLDPDADGDGITNDNEMDASTQEIEYDPFNSSSTPPDMDLDGIPDKLDKDADGDGFPNELEEERGSDQYDENMTPFTLYGEQETGLFYVPGEGFKSQYDPNGIELSVSALIDIMTGEFLIPILMIPITIFALLRKGRRYKRMRRTLENCKDSDILSEYEKGIDDVIMKRKIKVEHGMLLRNLYERKREELEENKSISGLKRNSSGNASNDQGRRSMARGEPGGQGGGMGPERHQGQQGPQRPSPGRQRPGGGQGGRNW